ncbi:MAG: LysR family transcriptional regulator [Hyphomicrobiales bacterium]|nr:LysR family transcriptional regulator [Hyphomicrobiales bacterium]
MIDHLRAMAVFATVADAGSFRAAANRLGLSASVVSHHITALERHLDTPLVYRTTRKLSLTDAGQRLAVRARAMVSEAEHGFGEIGYQSSNPAGRLSITAPAILQYARFVARVSAFMKVHPKVEILLTFSDRRVNIVEEGIDLAIRVGWLADSSLMARKLAEGKRHVCAAPAYLAGHRAVKAPDDLRHLELIDLVGVSRKFSLISNARPSRQREVQMHHRISVDSGFAARRMAEQGCGVVVMPDFFVREAIDADTLVDVLPAWHASPYGIYAVWPPNAGTNHLRTSFLDFIAEIARTDADP